MPDQEPSPRRRRRWGEEATLAASSLLSLGAFFLLSGAIGKKDANAFDLAVTRGRLAPSARPLWDDWIEPILELIAVTAPDDMERRRMLDEAAERPLPPTMVGAATA